MKYGTHFNKNNYKKCQFGRIMIQMSHKWPNYYLYGALNCVIW